MQASKLGQNTEASDTLRAESTWSSILTSKTIVKLNRAKKLEGRNLKLYYFVACTEFSPPIPPLKDRENESFHTFTVAHTFYAWGGEAGVFYPQLDYFDFIRILN